jgi:putative FmdB family regulatory protein
MPIYSYHCAKCDKDFELLIGMSEKPACPTCKSKKLDRLVGRVAKPPKGGKLRKPMRAKAARGGNLSNFSGRGRRTSKG